MRSGRNWRFEERKGMAKSSKRVGGMDEEIVVELSGSTKEPQKVVLMNLK